MSDQSPRHATRRGSLELLRKEAGSLAALADAMGKPKMRHHLSNIASGKRGMGDDLAAALESACHKPPGWMDRLHAAETVAPYQATRPQRDLPLMSDDLPLLPWEALMTLKKTPELFRTLLNDDALAPQYPRGTDVVWTTRRRVLPGRVVLIRDAHQQLHARICAQSNQPGQWLAMATHPQYVNMQSRDDQLEVIAVMKGTLEPDDA